jgi:DNA polymerase III epsilon subunit-like protein
VLLFFDTETSGKYDFKADIYAPHQPHLVQIACILDDLMGNTIEEYETVVRVGDINIPLSTQEIHGISTAIANEKGIDIAVALTKFDKMCKGVNQIVCHNTDFDIKILHTSYHRASMESTFRDIPTYCTMKNSTDLLKLPGRYGYKWPKLDEAYRVLIDPEGFEGAHDALNDVRACRKVYYALRKVGR